MPDVRCLDAARSAPLSGADLGRLRPGATERLEPGSLLVLYSDGLVERRDEELQQGLARLAAAAAELVASPIDEVCDRLVAALGVESPRDDDVAVLAARLEARGRA